MEVVPFYISHQRNSTLDTKSFGSGWSKQFCLPESEIYNHPTAKIEQIIQILVHHGMDLHYPHPGPLVFSVSFNLVRGDATMTLDVQQQVPPLSRTRTGLISAIDIQFDTGTNHEYLWILYP